MKAIVSQTNEVEVYVSSETSREIPFRFNKSKPRDWSATSFLEMLDEIDSILNPVKDSSGEPITIDRKREIARKAIYFKELLEKHSLYLESLKPLSSQSYRVLSFLKKILR